MNDSVTKPQLLNPYFTRLQVMLSEITGVDLEDITYGMDVSELSMTPMELAEFLSRLNKEYSLGIKANTLIELETIGKLSEYIEDELE